MLLAYVWCVHGREVRRGSSHKSLLDFSREQQVLQSNLKMQMLPEMCTRISCGMKKLSGLGRREELETAPSSSSTETSPDLSGCMMKWPGELNQLENSALSHFSWVIFHLENFPARFTSRTQKCLY